MKDKICSAQIILPCVNLNRELEFFTEHLGFRVEMIFPADAPSTALISGYGLTLRLENSAAIQPLTLKLFGDFSTLDVAREIYSPDGVCVILADVESSIEIPDGTNEFVLTTLENENSWNAGRAGMFYRDLIPNRLGGRFIASHIRISEGGEVPDYVHFHKIRFQMIYCLAGWAKLVYEDQGQPFLMKAGDCVLQPPEIRHRVLESSDNFEVLEIGCPAIHETFADHELNLPNDKFSPKRIFGNQRFIHYIAEKAVWKPAEFDGFETRDTGIFAATNGLADVRAFRAIADIHFSVNHSDEFLFFFVIKGKLSLSDAEGNIYHLTKDESVVLPSNTDFSINAEKGLEMIQVSL